MHVHVQRIGKLTSVDGATIALRCIPQKNTLVRKTTFHAQTVEGVSSEVQTSHASVINMYKLLTVLSSSISVYQPLLFSFCTEIVTTTTETMSVRACP